MSRILIAGGPRTGKTTLANELAKQTGIPARHTDDLIGSMGWSDASEAVSHWFEEPGPFIVEGVCVVRALRKFCYAHMGGTPADRIIWLTRAVCHRTPGQETMAKGCETVWREILPGLRARGVTVEIR